MPNTEAEMEADAFTASVLLNTQDPQAIVIAPNPTTARDGTNMTILDS
jgi:hypothetical protein